MTPRPLHELLDRAGVSALGPVPKSVLVHGLRLDSRRVLPGDLFFALPGTRDDGARHAPQAVEKGAVAIVAETEAPASSSSVPWIRVAAARPAMALVAREWWGRPDEGMTLVGITGTKGKTTVAHLVESIARSCGRRPGRIGTVGNAFDGRELEAARTTPEATDLYELLASMRAAGVEIVAMEVSSHALSLHRVGGARFSIAAFLNLGRDHLDFHGSPEAYFGAKASLFERLTSRDVAVLPEDDPLGEELAGRTRARVLTFGRGRQALIRLATEASTLAGSTARLSTPVGDVEIRTSLPGRFNLLNAAASAACGIAFGADADAIARGIAGVARVPGRLDPVDAGQPFAVLVDYAHTAESLEAVLDAVRELTDGRVIVVFGCGGDRDRGKRFAMGRIAASRADRVVLTSDNPRTEDPTAILAEIESGVASVPGAGPRSTTVVERARAIPLALSEARSGDAVVIAGKGHETTQTLADRTIPFDDRDVARQALASLGFGGGSRADA
ncbi:MAG TPA: UDP-N-acetylmuramoyl-L-alanyl-D-glutamate--2,6-diaminopimelate ligase [Candidatus Polarisedimenticolaceae bacterium]|nr:UDP-N-acetylmuramoyl-L-alanyl-D-glutamate--2,6-diaminopimelate ligase [Candidatus Polarisedimenticolaceae bacterium]